MSNRVIIMREATVRIVKMLAEKEVKVTQRGARAFVEYSHTGRPLRVNIPYIPDDASDELLDAIQGFMDHEVAHILFTDYRVLAAAKKAGVARLHNIVEDSFIERKMAQAFAGSGLNLRNVGQFFLKTYTDKELAEKPELAEGLLFVPAVRAWAGQTVFIDYMADKWHLMEKVTAALGDAVKEVPNCATSQDCLDLTLKFRDLLEAAKPKHPKPEPKEDEEPSMTMKMPGKGTPGTDDDETEPDLDLSGDDDIPEMDVGRYTADDEERSEEIEPPAEAKSPAESDDVTLPDVAEDGEPLPEPTEGEDDDLKIVAEEETPDEAPETPESEVPEMSEVDHDADVGTAAKDPKGEGEAEWDGAGDDELEGKGVAGGPDDGDDDLDEGGPSMLDELERKLGEKDYDDAIAEALTAKSVDDSKGADYLVYTTELDVIEPMDVGSHRGVWSESHLKMLTDTVDHMVGPLQKDLERAMAARSAATWSSGHRSGRLHPSALARLTAFNDDRVFRRKHINESKDVAVELLVDCSGSMTGSKIRTAAYAAYGLSCVLDRMGLANEVLGFTTQDALPAEMRAEERRLGVRYARHETLYHPIIKSFNERMTSETKKRFAALPSVNWLSENVDGESIQIAAARLAQRREKRKILMVLSDGQPACPGDFRMLAQHLKKSVRDVERSGIDVIAIGIQSDAPRHFYSKYVLLSDVSELPNAVIGQIKGLLMK